MSLEFELLTVCTEQQKNIVNVQKKKPQTIVTSFYLFLYHLMLKYLSLTIRFKRGTNFCSQNFEFSFKLQLKKSTVYRQFVHIYEIPKITQLQKFLICSCLLFIVSFCFCFHILSKCKSQNSYFVCRSIEMLDRFQIFLKKINILRCLANLECRPYIHRY